jgi:hypothetical protein
LTLNALRSQCHFKLDGKVRKFTSAGSFEVSSPEWKIRPRYIRVPIFDPAPIDMECMLGGNVTGIRGRRILLPFRWRTVDCEWLATTKVSSVSHKALCDLSPATRAHSSAISFLLDDINLADNGKFPATATGPLLPVHSAISIPLI